MNTVASNPCVLREPLSGFVQRSVSINVAACGDRGPVVSRAYGCLVDGPQVVLLLNRGQGHEVLAGVRTHGAVAAVFSRPTTHQTVQLKGIDGRVEPALDGDSRALNEYLDSLRAELQQVGFHSDFFDGLVAGADRDLVRVRFTPREAFDQTPGINAGRPWSP